MRRLLVTTPRGSGGALTHLRRVLPLIMRARPAWRVELHAPAELLRAAFGRDDAPWMVTMGGAGYGGRLRWEMVDMPAEVERVPGTLLYSPFGPMLNVAAARRAVWASRNIIPLLPPDTWEIEDADRLRTLALRGLVAFSARVAPRTICVSEHARASLMALTGLSGETIRVIPHGADVVEPDRRCADAAAEAIRRVPYVLNVGQPTPYRRTRELIAGYARLAARRSDLPVLVLVGNARPVDRAYGEECSALVEPLVRAGKAVHLGQLPHGDVLALTASAHVVAYPSVHEDCPNVILEALAGGRVIVCADVPATRELAEGAAVFVRDPHPAGIERALDDAIHDDALRRDLGRRARERAALFTWERCAESTVGVLEEAFRAPGPGRRGRRR
ncbi:MAG TPA: glycosyltransferase [Polyangiaceae bacterium]